MTAKSTLPQSEAAQFDIVIVGGGITGAGIARDAALRGLRVALFEKGDFGSGTSSKSSKLIHGGLRYLEHGEIALVFESVSERYTQGKVAPHLVRPLRFLVPVYKGARWGLEIINIGVWMYDALALFRAPRVHRTFRGKKACKIEPELKQTGLTGAIEYYDSYTDDARLVLENIISAEENGASCFSYHKVVGAKKRNGRVREVLVRNELTGVETSVPTRSVILATGPWTDEVTSELGPVSKLLRPTKGTHLVFPKEKLPIERAITLVSPVDGRVMFAIPWRDRVVIGTTDTDYTGSADHVNADQHDAQYLCDSANGYFPNANFSTDDIISTWSGLRPLIHEEAEEASAVSREHQIYLRDDGVMTIAGGKLTTYRIMAKEMVTRTIRWLRDRENHVRALPIKEINTAKLPLPGAQGLSTKGWKGIEDLALSLAKDFSLDANLASHLAWTYGVRATALCKAIVAEPLLAERIEDDLPHVWAEVDYVARYERVTTLEDILARRVPLILIGRQQGLDVAKAVAKRVAPILGWDEEQILEEVALYQSHVEESRRFRKAS